MLRNRAWQRSTRVAARSASGPGDPSNRYREHRVPASLCPCPIVRDHIVCGPAPCWIVVPLRGETAQHRAKPCPLISLASRRNLISSLFSSPARAVILVLGRSSGGQPGRGG